MMSEYLLESDVSYYKFTCHNCNNNIYHDYKCLEKCPHCGAACGEETKNSKEMLTATIYYEIDAKTGEIAVYSPDD